MNCNLPNRPWNIEKCKELDVLFINDAIGRCICEICYGCNQNDISYDEANAILLNL